jgi:hypothetical protein
MSDLVLTGMNRRSKSLRRRSRDRLHRVLGAVDALVAAEGSQTVTAFFGLPFQAAGSETLLRAIEILRVKGPVDRRDAPAELPDPENLIKRRNRLAPGGPGCCSPLAGQTQPTLRTAGANAVPQPPGMVPTPNT